MPHPAWTTTVFVPNLVVVSCLLLQCTAWPQFVASIPNAALFPEYHALGHHSKYGGGSLSVFGKAFANAGFQWTAAFCEADSDNDGLSNGMELGDPCCQWTVRGDPVDIAGFRSGDLSHPGLAEERTRYAAPDRQTLCRIHDSSYVHLVLPAARNGTKSTAVTDVAPSSPTPSRVPSHAPIPSAAPSTESPSVAPSVASSLPSSSPQKVIATETPTEETVWDVILSYYAWIMQNAVQVLMFALEILL